MLYKSSASDHDMPISHTIFILTHLKGRFTERRIDSKYWQLTRHQLYFFCRVTTVVPTSSVIKAWALWSLWKSWTFPSRPQRPICQPFSTSKTWTRRPLTKPTMSWTPFIRTASRKVLKTCYWTVPDTKLTENWYESSVSLVPVL